MKQTIIQFELEVTFEPIEIDQLAHIKGGDGNRRRRRGCPYDDDDED